MPSHPSHQKKPKSQHKKRGRKPLPIVGSTVQKLARLGMKSTEIAGMMLCDESVIRKRFKREFNFGHALYVESIRKGQKKSIDAGNVAMLIFLGKNVLQQTDKQEHTHSGEVEQKTTHVFDHDAYKEMFSKKTNRDGKPTKDKTEGAADESPKAPSAGRGAAE